MLAIGIDGDSMDDAAPYIRPVAFEYVLGEDI